jgi:hypothetical protein
MTDGSGDTIAVGTPGLTVTVGGVQQGIWTATGLGVGTTAPGTKLDVNGNIRIENAAGIASPNQLQLMTGAASERWAVTTDGVAESGSSTGSDLILQGFNNSGASLGTPSLLLTRAGDATFAGSVSASNFVGSGAGLTGIGTSSITGVIGSANGGTGTGTTFTQGSVVFAGPGGVYAQDNANFFWNDSMPGLGIGTSSPGNSLDVNGSADIGYPGTAAPAKGLIVLGSTGIGTANPSAPLEIATNTYNMTFTPGSFNTIGGSGSGTMRLTVNGDGTRSLYLTQASDAAFNVGLGVSSPAARLEIYGGAGTMPKLMVSSSSTSHGDLLYMSSIGYIGVGTTNPNSLLQAYKGEIQTGSSGAACSSSNGGALRFSGNSIYYCDGVSTWQALYSSGSGSAVTGSGTVNYVARWTPSGITLGTGTLYDNGAQVGVGTNAPAELLTVAGTDVGTYAPASASVYAPWTAGTSAVVQADNLSSVDNSAAYDTFKVANTAGDAQRAYIGAVSTTGSGVYSPALTPADSHPPPPSPAPPHPPSPPPPAPPRGGEWDFSKWFRYRRGAVGRKRRKRQRYGGWL